MDNLYSMWKDSCKYVDVSFLLCFLCLSGAYLVVKTKICELNTIFNQCKV